MKWYGMALLAIVFSAAGQLLMKAGATSLRGCRAPAEMTSWLQCLASPEALGGLACWGLSTLAWFAALAHQPLSHVYGLSSLNFIIVPLAAGKLFHEDISRGNVLGMILIAAGIAISLWPHQKGIEHALR